jgi:hypothetical protein
MFHKIVVPAGDLAVGSIQAAIWHGVQSQRVKQLGHELFLVFSCVKRKASTLPDDAMQLPGTGPPEHDARPSSFVCSSVLAFRKGSVAPLLISSFLNLFLFPMASAQKCRATLQTTCTSHKPVSESGGSIPFGVDSLHKKAKRK